MTKPAVTVTLEAIRTKPKAGRTHAYVYTARDAITQELLVERGTDVACALARELLSRGITEQAKVIDARTGKHRYTVNIKKAATMIVREDRAIGPTLIKWRECPAELRGQDTERRKEAA
ncbi:MAG: hypothetical protein GY948_16380 [Alphaproteobacteria bacterium]|nr:hypothetical protein [Alphaproteobacteria bacterium]